MSICNDALIASIRNRLWSDRRVSALCIDVCCNEGYVCLVGCVDKPEQKELAVQIVYGVAGVRSVTDELTIRCPRVAQAAIVDTESAAIQDIVA